MFQIGEIHLGSAIVEHVNQFVANHCLRHFLRVNPVLADDYLIVGRIVTTSDFTIHVTTCFTNNMAIQIDFTARKTRINQMFKETVLSIIPSFRLESTH